MLRTLQSSARPSPGRSLYSMAYALAGGAGTQASEAPSSLPTSRSPARTAGNMQLPAGKALQRISGRITNGGRAIVDDPDMPKT